MAYTPFKDATENVDIAIHMMKSEHCAEAAEQGIDVGHISLDDGAAMVRFNGKPVAVLNEYETAYVMPGLETVLGHTLEFIKEYIEEMVDKAFEIYPGRYDPENPICFKCGYRRNSLAVHEVEGQAPNNDNLCPGFTEIPEHLRF